MIGANWTRPSAPSAWAVLQLIKESPDQVIKYAVRF
jgi:hypothetical protein